MSTVTHCKASISTISKAQLKQQHPEPYSYLAIRQGFYHLYTCQEPNYALAEAWLKKITSTEAWWGLLQPCDDGRFFSMLVNNGDIITAHVSTFDELDTVLLARCDIVYTVETVKTMSNPSHQPTFDYTTESIPPLTDKEIAPFALKKGATLLHKILIGTFISAVIVGGGYGLFHTAPPPAAPAVPIDPYLVYRTTVNHAHSAAEIIQQGIALGAISGTLPFGWQLDTVSLQGSVINVTAKRTLHGQRTVISEWIDQHPQLKPYADLSLNTLTINIPLQQTLAQWHDKIMRTEPSLSSVIDTLIALGWQVTKLTHDNGGWSVTSRWTTTKNTALTDLSTLQKICSSLPITITKFAMTPSGNIGLFKIQLQFAFMGKK